MDEGQVKEFERFALAYDCAARTTSVDQLVGFSPWPYVRITRAFRRTVKIPRSGKYDSYLRPVNWVLISKLEKQPTFLLVISQFEADQFMDRINGNSSNVRLLSYQAHVTKSSTSVDFSPRDPASVYVQQWQTLAGSLRQELHLFAGQLYLNSYKDYRKLCRELEPAVHATTGKTLFFIKQ